MERGEDGWWRLPKEYVQIPFLFSLRARKDQTGINDSSSA